MDVVDYLQLFAEGSAEQHAAALPKSTPTTQSFNGNTTTRDATRASAYRSRGAFPEGEATDLIADAVQVGWPMWMTSRDGSEMPKRMLHDFVMMKLQVGARIDFSRGKAEDVFPNAHWETMLLLSPFYRQTLTQDPQCTNSRGNAMEQAVGVAFAAATKSSYLKHGKLDWTRESSISTSEAALKVVWKALEKLGVKASLDDLPQREDVPAEATCLRSLSQRRHHRKSKRPRSESHRRRSRSAPERGPLSRNKTGATLDNFAKV